MNIETHAYQVVDGFRKSLTDEQLEVLGKESLEELHILIEAALGKAISTALHETVKEVEALAQSTRKRLTSIERLEQYCEEEL